MQKLGWKVRGHPKSPAMSAFDRVHTTSYSTLTGTMHLSCTVSKLQHVICQKSPILTYPTCIWRPRGGDAIRISQRSLASENQRPWSMVCCWLHDPMFNSRFDTIPAYIRWTDRDKLMIRSNTVLAYCRTVKPATDQNGILITSTYSQQQHHQQQWFYGCLSGTTRCFGTRRNIHQLTPILIINHPLSASSAHYDPQLYSLFVFASPLWSTSWSGIHHFILHTFLHPIIAFFSQHMPIASQPVIYSQFLSQLFTWHYIFYLNITNSQSTSNLSTSSENQ